MTRKDGQRQFRFQGGKKASMRIIPVPLPTYTDVYLGPCQCIQIGTTGVLAVALKRSPHAPGFELQEACAAPACQQGNPTAIITLWIDAARQADTAACVYFQH